ncbi:MAG: FAD:protein FMN transferase [Deltaproteobacteria bacterium]|nr:FAD:protein FMN transferase [Deltaproteobacteria bacterium]
MSVGLAGVALLTGLGLAARHVRSATATPRQRVRVARALMGTEVEVVVWSAAGRASAARAAAEAALDDIARLEGLLSDYRADSEIGRLGRGETVLVSADTRAVLAEARSWSERSGGAFDATRGALYQRWRAARAAGQLPAPGELSALVALGGWDEVREEAGRLRLGRPGMRLDLGGVAKGFAAERASALLLERSFPDHLVDCGGDLAVAGSRDGAPWRLAIPDPRGRGVVATLLVRPGTVATSGDAQRFFEVGGVRYGHIIDPRTGWPARGTASVTALAPEGADALATALYVLGPERGLALLAGLPEAHAIFVAADGAVRLSPGLRRRGAVIEVAR